MDQQSRYYQLRAREYEAMYRIPDRQGELAQLRDLVGSAFTDQDILELACGTGYWTEVLARTARSVTASDLHREMLDVAREKAYPNQNVSFQVQDLRDLYGTDQAYQGLFAGFIWSHIARSEHPALYEMLIRQVQPGATILLIDNTHVPGVSTPIHRRDAEGNSYQLRQLQSGQQFEILKNYPDPEVLATQIAPWADHFQWRELTYYWVASFRRKEE